MREEVGYSVKDVSDHTHKELQPKEVLKVFNEKYVNICDQLNYSKYTSNRNTVEFQQKLS